LVPLFDPQYRQIRVVGPSDMREAWHTAGLCRSAIAVRSRSRFGRATSHR